MKRTVDCFPLCLFLGAFSFYVLTLAPGLMPGDSGDVMVAAATFREAHPPGYPLYGLLGKLFVALPVGDIPYRVNLMSAFLGGLAVTLVYLSVRLLTGHFAASLVTALLFAFSNLFWTYFVIAEVFCLNNFLLALTAFLALWWRRRHQHAPGSLSERQMLALLAFVTGLGLGNHLTLALTCPGLLLFVVQTDRQALRPRRLLPLLGLFVLGFALPYAYLAGVGVLWPAHHWEDPTTFRGLARLLLRAKYGTFRFVADSKGRVDTLYQAGRYLSVLATQFLWPAFLLGLAGVAVAAARDRAFLLYTGSAFLLGTTVVVGANVDPRVSAFEAATMERLYQLPFFFFLLWIGLGLGALVQAAQRLALPAGLPTRVTGARSRGILIAGALLALPVALLVRNAPHTSQRGNRLYPRFLENVYRTLPPNAVFITSTDTVSLGVDFLDTVERRRPDVAHVMLGILGTEPYTSVVRRRYPHLFWPTSVHGEPFDLGRFIGENLRRHRVFLDVGNVPIEYPLVRRGILWEARHYRERLAVDEFARANEALWRRYDLRQVDTARYPNNSMCRTLVELHYLEARLCLASDYRDAGLHALALRHLEAAIRMMDAAPWRMRGRCRLRPRVKAGRPKRSWLPSVSPLARGVPRFDSPRASRYNEGVASDPPAPGAIPFSGSGTSNRGAAGRVRRTLGV